MTASNAPFPGDAFERLCEQLAEQSGALEAPRAWPEQQFQLLAENGVLGWVIPQEFGGSDIAPEDLIVGYQRLAQACLVTTFVLTQRNGACQRIAGSENPAVKELLLRPLCGGEIFATVGISHLTTSRQHMKQPAVTVHETDQGFVFDGWVPWVTGAAFADVIVTGGTLDDGRQILAAIPTRHTGVEIGTPAELLALNASQTGPVELHAVEIDREHLIAGPIEQVMKRGTGGGAGSVTTSALAVGTAAAALALLRGESEKRPDLREIHAPLATECDEIFQHLAAAARGESADNAPHLSAESIRRRANSLALRSTQALLAASKGAGFVKGHPAERLVREAMFFLVWSCPQPVLHAALREFACIAEG